ncbi:hypothetical protein BDZ88DRAFT_407968 [Geranomyces variabilis]|nr:hypothetical protein BDZ88DRAFT_407968 [Geranomyces variabilis]KAJ3142309.1 hypothetical protein HDU90_004582 [Geranomyces variabilis]
MSAVQPPAVPRTVIFHNMLARWRLSDVKQNLEDYFGPVENIELQIVSEDLDLYRVRVLFQRQQDLDACLAVQPVYHDDSDGRTTYITDYRPRLSDQVFPLITWDSTEIGIAPLVNAFDVPPAQQPAQQQSARPLSPASAAWASSTDILMGGRSLPARTVRQPRDVVLKNTSDGPKVKLTDVKMGLPNGLVCRSRRSGTRFVEIRYAVFRAQDRAPLMVGGHNMAFGFQVSLTRTHGLHPLFFMAVENTTAGAIRRLTVPTDFDMREVRFSLQSFLILRISLFQRLLKQFTGQWPSGLELVVVVEVVTVRDHSPK